MTLTPVATRPECGHQFGRLACIREQHDHAPRGHVYVSTTGSHVGAEKPEADR